MTTKEMLLSHHQWAFGISTILGSWSEHYLSWKRINFAPRIIVKYEDLINDTKNSFIEILKFLNQTMNIQIDEKKVLNTINSCSFDALARKEKKEGFFEQVLSKHDNKKLKFFNLGKKNNWKSLLDPKIEKRIREAFLEEMSELNYI